MRLIDADVFIEYINNWFTIFNDDFVELINSQPTAYDQEKVIKEIHEYFKKVIDDSKSDNIPLEVLTYNKNICEIVRLGGVKNEQK